MATRMHQAFDQAWGREEVRLMTEGEKAIARACLEQTLLALGEAREILRWWGMLGEDVRDQYTEFQELAQKLRVNLGKADEIRPVG